MIKLPPGCTVAYGITIDVTELTNDMVEWYHLIEGTVKYDEYYGYKGTRIEKPYVSFNSKECHYMQDGTGNVRLHFLGRDASTASVFLLKFNEYIVRHNLKEVNELHY